MHICTRISDGFLAGSQSHAPRAGAMQAQAAQDYGGMAEDYLEQEVDDASCAVLREARDLASLTLDQAKARKTSEIRDAAEAFLAPFGVEHGPTERATWDQQLAEAQALAADPEALAPLLSTIAAARGMDLAVLAARVRANRDAWVLLAGHVTGQRLAFQDQVDAAGTVEEVQAINPVFSLPE